MKDRTQSKDSIRPKPENGSQVMGAMEWGLIVVLSIIWGGSFFFVGVAAKELPPLTIVLSRVALASLILLAIIYLRGHKMPSSPSMWGAFLVMGALNVCSTTIGSSLSLILPHGCLHGSLVDKIAPFNVSSKSIRRS